MTYLFIAFGILFVLYIQQARTVSKLKKAQEEQKKTFDDFTKKQHKLNKEVLRATDHVLSENNYYKQWEKF